MILRQLSLEQLQIPKVLAQLTTRITLDEDYSAFADRCYNPVHENATAML